MGDMMRLQISVNGIGHIVMELPESHSLVAVFFGAFPKQMRETVEEWLPHAHVEIHSVTVSEKRNDR